jgi:hypothetical protein
MIILTYSISVLLFCIIFLASKIVITCKLILNIANQAVKTISDSSLDDLEKEKLTQASAIAMSKQCIILTFKLAILLACTAAPIGLADIMGLADYDDSVNFALRIDVLIVTTVLLMLLVFLQKKLFKKT